MKLKLPRRRWLVLAGCIAVIGCGFVLMYVEYVEVQRRYQRMAAIYERVRIGMTRSAVRATVGQVPTDRQAWIESTKRREIWRTERGDSINLLPPGRETTWDGWLDHDVYITVTYKDGKAIQKFLDKRDFRWKWIARDWFARLRRLFS